MNLFGYAKLEPVKKLFTRHETRLDAADTDRRRLKGNLDKLGAQVTDLECRLKNLNGGKCNSKKHSK